MAVTVEDVNLSQTKKKPSPPSGVTKEALVKYYEAVAAFIIPHLKDRPLALSRQTEEAQEADANGITSLPDYIQTITLASPDKQSDRQYILCQNIRTLTYLVESDANIVAAHAWLSRFDKPELPDKMVIDLNPPDVTYFEEVVRAAFVLKTFMEEANMCPYIMTTGSNGLHLVCPLRRNRSFDRVRAFLKDLTEKAAEQHPQLLTTESRKERRGEKIHLDISSNTYGQSSVVPYSVRPMAHAPVATPLRWEELERDAAHPQKFNMANILDRLQEEGDAWDNFYRHKRKLMK